MTTLSLGGLTAPASAQQPSEAHIQELIRVGRRAHRQRPRRHPGPDARRARRPAAADTRPVVRLSLDDAVKLALDRNLDIAVQRLNPQINDIAIAEPAVGLPSDADVAGVLRGSSGQPVDDDHRRQQRRRGHAIDTNLTTYNGGIAQNVPLGRRHAFGRR